MKKEILGKVARVVLFDPLCSKKVVIEIDKNSKKIVSRSLQKMEERKISIEGFEGALYGYSENFINLLNKEMP
jgi:hypothetical protein